MKRYGYLYEKIMTAENVKLAWLNYNKSRPLYKRRVYDPVEAAEILELMRTDFAAVIGKPRVKHIYESGKLRRLQIPSFRSCVAQLAVWNVCGALIERRIHGNSYSSRRGMGGHKLAKKVARFVRTKGRGEARYCLYFDIKKFYEHIDKRIVIDRVRNVIKDEKVVALFETIVGSTDCGLSIGYPFSHALANFYLVPLYFLVKSIRQVSRIWVYMDNWLVFSRFKKPLHLALKHAKAWLWRMGCHVKRDWQIFPTRSRAVKACGLCVWAGGRVRLYRRLWRRTVRQFDRLVREWRAADYRGMRSRLGWLDMINGRFHPQFKIEGGYIW